MSAFPSWRLGPRKSWNSRSQSIFQSKDEHEIEVSIPMQDEHEKSEDEEAAQRPTSFLGFGCLSRNRSHRRLRRVEKWETGLWFSTFPSDASWGGGNVEISLLLRDFQGAVGSVGNLLSVFHAFHGPGISTALRF
jgi:hypothetical protein